MFTRDAAIAKVGLFIEKLIAAAIPLDKAILFGCYAKNRRHKDSDIDVALYRASSQALVLKIENISAASITSSLLSILKPKLTQPNIMIEATPFIAEINKTGGVLYDALQTHTPRLTK